MASTDGEVDIAIEMNIDDAEKELAALKSRVFSLEKDVGLKKFLKESLVDQTRQAAANLDEAKKKLSDMQGADSGTYSGDAIKEQEERVKLLQREYDKSATELEKVTAQIERGNAELEYTKQRYAEVVAEAERLREAEAERLREAEAQNEPETSEPEPQTGGFKERFADFGEGLKDGLGSAAKVGFKALGSGLKKIQGSIKSAFSKGLQFVKSFGKGLLGAAKNLNVFSKISGKLGPALSKLGSMVKQAFVFGVVTKGLNYVREQMGGLMSKNTEFMAALNRLKGVLLTAFQPIYDAIMPALTTLINGLTRAMAVVAQFVAALFGKTAAQAQESAKALNSESESLEGTGEAAEEAAGSLAGFDEINTIQTEDSKGGGGGGAAAAEEEAPVFDYAFEEMEGQAPFESWGAAFDAFLAKLLAGIPQLRSAFDTFTGDLNGYTQKLLDTFTFPGVEEKVKALGMRLAGALNGLVSGINWNQMGQALGAGLNLALQFLVNLLFTFDWAGLGKSLADAVNGIVYQIDWTAFGQLLASGFTIGLDLLTGFLLGLDMTQIAEAASNLATGFFDSLTAKINSIDWAQVAAQISTFVNGIDWNNVGDSASNLVKEFLNSLNTFISNTDWKGVGQSITEFITSIDWAGVLDSAQNLIHTFADGLVDFISGIDWVAIGVEVAEFLKGIDWSGIIEDLFKIIGAAFAGLVGFLWGLVKEAWQKLTDWWKNEIEGKSAKEIIQGLWDGITKALSNIWSWIKEHIFQPFIDGFKKVFGIHSPSTVMSEQGNLLMEGLKQGVKDRIGAVVETFSGLWDKIKDVFSHIKDWFKEKFSSAWQAVKDVFSTGGKIFDGIKDGILDALKNVINAIINGINKVISVPFNGLNSALSKIRNVDILGVKPFSWINTISIPQIPKLAQGAVIPPNREFMAVLGDQRSGNNIEAPEDLIRKIVREETGGNAEMVALLRQILSATKARQKLYVKERVLAETARDGINDMTRQAGKPVILF